MRSKYPTIRIEGILGTYWKDGTHFDDMLFPVADLSDLRSSFDEVVSPLMGTDSEKSTHTHISVWPVILDLSRGAWQHWHNINDHRYWKPVLPPNDIGPLAWTLNPAAPLMCGAGWKAQNGAYAFGGFEKFNGTMYAMDVRGGGSPFSYKVYKEGSGVWSDALAGLTSQPTELHLDVEGDALLVGQTTGNTRKYNGTTWSDAGFAGQHFAVVGDRLWYSTGRKITERLPANTSGTPRTQNFGWPSTNITKMLWTKQLIVVSKPEGIFGYDPAARAPFEIFRARHQDDDNGRVLLMYDGDVWFNCNYDWYRWTPGYKPVRQTFFQTDDDATSPFAKAKVIKGYTDGACIYLLLENKLKAAYAYYVVIYTGQNGGYHPVFYARMPLGKKPSYPAYGVWFSDTQLRYSIGNTDQDMAGYLLTDGENPQCDPANSIFFGKEIGVDSGWLDMDRDHLEKYIREVRLSTYDYGDGTGQYLVQYVKWEDRDTIDFPPVKLAYPHGTLDNYRWNPTPEKVNNAQLIDGFTTTKVRFRVILKNQQANPQNAWYVTSLHAAGRVGFPKAFRATMRFLADDKELAKVGMDAEKLRKALDKGISQTEPVRVTWIDGETYVGKLYPSPGGMRPMALDRQDQSLQRETVEVAFMEDR